MYVILGDSSLHLTANIRADHIIFGYEKPDTTSQKLLLLSVFTSDVENNPYGLKLGSYYETSGMDKLSLKYKETVGDFIKVFAIENSGNTTELFIERKWVEFSE